MSGTLNNGAGPILPSIWAGASARGAEAQGAGPDQDNPRRDLGDDRADSPAEAEPEPSEPAAPHVIKGRDDERGWTPKTTP